MVEFNPDKPIQGIGIGGTNGNKPVKQKQISSDDFREAVRKLNENSTNIDTSELETIGNIEDLDDNTTSVTDKNGNLKPGASAGAALNDDGTLKPGWSIGADGTPKFSRMAQLKESAKGNDPGFAQASAPEREIDDPFNPGKKIKIGVDDPGFDGRNPLHPAGNAPGFDRPQYGVKFVPTYEVKDGKLVQTGQKIEEDKSIGL